MSMKRSVMRWAPVVALLLLAACVDSREVLVPTPLFTQPPAAAQGFLGYSDLPTKTPVCGSCHVGHFNEWKGTAHSHAWVDLQASDHAQASCEGCHTVGAYGNFVTDSMVAWKATKDERYLDVQCESCHGPGLQHVMDPDASQPLASLLVGLDRTNGCGECHSGTHNPFVEEWSQSAHGLVGYQSIAVRVAAGGGTCLDCHAGEGALKAWGERPNFMEKDSLEANGGHLSITCVVCHDPHDATNEKQLRYRIDVASLDDNLCMKCHHYRATPEATSSHGPMSPEGPLLLGLAGWRSPDFGPTAMDIRATHGSSANEDLCVTCHVARLDVTNEGGTTVFNSTGHLFVATPCLDADGKPTADDDCELAQRSFAACSSAGCHGEPANARHALEVARARIDALVEEVEALLAQVPATEWSTEDGRITTAEGAQFNAELGGEKHGSAIHNPFLVEALLTASIKQLQKDYGLQVAGGVTLDNILPLAARE